MKKHNSIQVLFRVNCLSDSFLNTLTLKRLIFLFLFSTCLSAQAQKIDKNELSEKLAPAIQRMGAMEGFTIRAMVDSFKTLRCNETEMSFVIYYWITHHIVFDSRDASLFKQANYTASSTLSERKAGAKGYAALFKAFCDVARIKCVIVDGLAKSQPQDIGNISSKNNHSWNAVLIDNSWYNIDATWGAGTVDEHYKNFRFDYTDAWFFTNRWLFNRSHFPNKSAQPVSDDPITKISFANAPIIYPAAIIFQLKFASDTRGLLTGRAGSCKRFLITLPSTVNIHSAQLQMGAEIIALDIDHDEKYLYLDVPILSYKKTPALLFLNNIPALGFKMDSK
ncbi:MAG: hypothetical protein JST88_04135 [Bacteroidetes bacterium]|nr:hypothetical protein [Bacteroidota bacterium]